jgi:hypothetical protein
MVFFLLGWAELSDENLLWTEMEEKNSGDLKGN